ncbi:hypothetical protein [Streptomyces sp. SID161]|uniref:hypothetical protein n=1 Tax=Streptomyces sp. SID161 TaxID=2690251 RepID=UPI00136F8FD8|nr:hypothetical protein [Streptomyces sp. SID161]MYW48860.1 hypothetical protein [Streptomyces sp. SID161]MYW49855.1 hypothetical protein [Streptomyces sp. SID161]
MEPQTWRNLGVEGRLPTPAVTAIAVVLFYMLHQQHGGLVALAVTFAVIGLDCVRIRPAQTGNLPPADISGGTRRSSRR